MIDKSPSESKTVAVVLKLRRDALANRCFGLGAIHSEYLGDCRSKAQAAGDSSRPGMKSAPLEGSPISSVVRASVLCAESHGFKPRMGQVFHRGCGV